MANPADPKMLSQERFDRFAERYVTSATHAKAPELQRLLELAQPKKEWAALDIAAGGGYTALKFAPFVKWVIGADITPGMLKAARRFIVERGAENISFACADAENLPFKSASFNFGSQQASFANQHILILGRKLEK